MFITFAELKSLEDLTHKLAIAKSALEDAIQNKTEYEIRLEDAKNSKNYDPFDKDVRRFKALADGIDDVINKKKKDIESILLEIKRETLIRNSLGDNIDVNKPMKIGTLRGKRKISNLDQNKFYKAMGLTDAELRQGYKDDKDVKGKLDSIVKSIEGDVDISKKKHTNKSTNERAKNERRAEAEVLEAIKKIVKAENDMDTAKEEGKLETYTIAKTEKKEGEKELSDLLEKYSEFDFDIDKLKQDYIDELKETTNISNSNTIKSVKSNLDSLARRYASSEMDERRYERAKQWDKVASEKAQREKYENDAQKLITKNSSKTNEDLSQYWDDKKTNEINSLDLNESTTLKMQYDSVKDTYKYDYKAYYIAKSKYDKAVRESDNKELIKELKDEKIKKETKMEESERALTLAAKNAGKVNDLQTDKSTIESEVKSDVKVKLEQELDELSTETRESKASLLNKYENIYLKYYPLVKKLKNAKDNGYKDILRELGTEYIDINNRYQDIKEKCLNSKVITEDELHKLANTLSKKIEPKVESEIETLNTERENDSNNFKTTYQELYKKYKTAKDKYEDGSDEDDETLRKLNRKYKDAKSEYNSILDELKEKHPNDWRTLKRSYESDVTDIDTVDEDSDDPLALRNKKNKLINKLKQDVLPLYRDYLTEKGKYDHELTKWRNGERNTSPNPNSSNSTYQSFRDALEDFESTNKIPDAIDTYSKEFNKIKSGVEQRLNLVEGISSQEKEKQEIKQEKATTWKNLTEGYQIKLFKKENNGRSTIYYYGSDDDGNREMTTNPNNRCIFEDETDAQSALIDLNNTGMIKNMYMLDRTGKQLKEIYPTKIQVKSSLKQKLDIDNFIPSGEYYEEGYGEYNTPSSISISNSFNNNISSIDDMIDLKFGEEENIEEDDKNKPSENGGW